jgi:hypothetical protein
VTAGRLGQLAGHDRRELGRRLGERHRPLPPDVPAREAALHDEREAEPVRRALDVDEEDVALRREARPRELRVEVVAGELVHLAPRSQSHDPVDPVSVLGEPDVAPRRHDHVVGTLHLIGVRRLEEQLEDVAAALLLLADPSAARNEAEHLAEPRLAARSVVEPERSAGEVAAFEAVELRRSLRERGGVGVGGIDGDPADAEALSLLEEVGVRRRLVDGERLQDATRLQRARPAFAVGREVPVEKLKRVSRFGSFGSIVPRKSSSVRYATPERGSTSIAS